MTTCRVCHAATMQRMADRRGGHCLKCHLRLKWLSSPDSGRRRELYQRLIAVDQDPHPVMQNSWLQEDSTFLERLECTEESKRRYLEWAPHLRQFAKASREILPIPDASEWSASDREKQRIVELRPPYHSSSKYRVTICSMPLLALAVARRCWPAHPDIVYLTSEERNQWFDTFYRHDDRYLWYSYWNLQIDDPPVRETPMGSGKTMALWSLGELEPGEQPWLFWGGSGTPLCGTSNSELWAWNGVRARLIRRG
ncbi:MAG: hypothetical protein QM703_25230 [Gemmatales bacterium]